MSLLRSPPYGCGLFFLRMKWLSNKVKTIFSKFLISTDISHQGYDLRAAVDGRQGVTVFEREGPFE